MNEIIKLVIDYKKEKEDELFLEIKNKVNYLFSKYLKLIDKYFADDLYQLFLIELFDNLIKFEIDYEIIEKIKKEKQDIKYINYPYMKNFFKKYDLKEEELEEKDYLYEYILFANENQFMHCLNKRLKYTYIDLLRSKEYKEFVENISLNTINEKNQELIEQIESKKQDKIDFDYLEEDERNFYLCLLTMVYFLQKKRLRQSLESVNRLLVKEKEK